MVRQYKIHTNLDGADNKVWDMTNGNIRLYLPSDFGLEIENNIFTSAGIGVVGTKIISQPDIEFNLETFCLSLADNYKILNEFVNDCLAQKFVTLEYQTENFQVYADLALKKVTKTEGYGNNGQFSEKITFAVITKWYTYENLSFDMIENGEVISGKSKIYGGNINTRPPFNYNLEQHTNLLVDASDALQWGTKGAKTDTMTYEAVKITGTNLTNGVHVTQTEIGVSGWRSPSGTSGSIAVTAGQEYTLSYWIKNNSDEELQIRSQIGLSATANQASPSYLSKDFTIPANSDWKRYIATYVIPTGKSFAWCYAYTATGTLKADWTFSGFKFEQGDHATQYTQTQTEEALTPLKDGAYNYIENTSYTYYGETDITRLSRWDIKNEIFSVVARLDPTTVNGESGIRFLDTNGTEYTALIFTPGQVQDYILINTDVNDEFYQGWRGTTMINLFPVMDFQRFRTRIIQKGQMLLVNLRGAEFKIKRKADFM